MTASPPIPADEVVRLRAALRECSPRSLAQRLESLAKLAAGLKVYERPLYEALKKDLGKSEHESFASEIAVVEHELHVARKNLRCWVRPRRVCSPLYLWPALSEIHYEPLGLVLIIGPWNYPVQLTLAPLVGALAAGNSVVVKPSELAPATSSVLCEMLTSVLSPDQVAVVEGGVGPTAELLRQKFDHIFFTGSTRVGQIVYEAAAKHLTPVTLELGGKSPAFVMKTADLDLAARRLVWGKFMNAGQTCVAPDYVYVHESRRDELLEKMGAEICAQLGDPSVSPDYGRIVNAANFDRLCRMLDPGKVRIGGQIDRARLYIAPTVMCDVTWQDPVMSEEIFGPLFPVLTFRDFDEACREIEKHGKPLAAYMFTGDRAEQAEFLRSLSFGGGCVNDVVVHLVSGRLPFGGVGSSGIGSYHGHRSFLTFSHEKSVVRKSKLLDLDMRYPPFSEGKLRRLKLLFRLSRW